MIFLLKLILIFLKNQLNSVYRLKRMTKHKLQDYQIQNSMVIDLSINILENKTHRDSSVPLIYIPIKYSKKAIRLSRINSPNKAIYTQIPNANIFIDKSRQNSQNEFFKSFQPESQNLMKMPKISASLNLTGRHRFSILNRVWFKPSF